MAENCIFCKIIDGRQPADIIYRDDLVTVFKDRRPAAPVHLLVIPNRHIDSINSVETDDAHLLGYLILIAQKQAELNNISRTGYRVLINTGPDAGQTVFHIHLHLMGGHRLAGLAQ